MTDQAQMPNYQQIYRIEFYECEHEGDLDDYCHDLRKSGATIVGTSVNHRAEIGYVRFRVKDDDYEAFFAKFKQTDAYEFIN